MNFAVFLPVMGHEGTIEESKGTCYTIAPWVYDFRRVNETKREGIRAGASYVKGHGASGQVVHVTHTSLVKSTHTHVYIGVYIQDHRACQLKITFYTRVKLGSYYIIDNTNALSVKTIWNNFVKSLTCWIYNVRYNRTRYKTSMNSYLS